MTAQATIRRATVHDAESVLCVYVDAWNEGFGDLMPHQQVTAERQEQWRVDLAAGSPHHWWVAEFDSVVVGVVGIGPCRDPRDPEIGELDTIAVAPSHWRSGIGRLLMDVALRQLESDGYREAALWTPAGYVRGFAFYEATGWRREDTTRDHGRQVMFRRDLQM